MKKAVVLVTAIIAVSSVWAGGTNERGRSASGGKQEIVVYTAASLTEAFTRIGNLFMKEHPDTSVTFNFAGSQSLAQQLALGASADVFASANVRQMDAAVKSGRITRGSAKIFAHNRLVVITSRTTSVPINSLADIAKPGVKIVMAASAVPVGAYTREFLRKAAEDPQFGPSYRRQVMDNTVSLEENVRAVLNKVVLGEGDAGVVYSSDLTAGSASKVKKIDIPDRLNTIADYPIAQVHDSADPSAASAFIDLVLSPAGQKILASYGFVPIASASMTAVK